MSMIRLAPQVGLLILGACNGAAPEPKDSRAASLAHAPFDTTALSGSELAAQLVPRHRSASVLLEPITDTRLIDELEATPPGRLANGPAQFEEDRKYQAEIGKLVREGIIGPSTLVFDDTTHALPNLARVLQEPSIGVVGTVHLPWSPYQAQRAKPGQSPDRAAALLEISQAAIADQAQTFGDVIAEQQEGAARRMATVLYVALNAARHVELRTEGWPRSDAYQIFGLTRVVVLVEAARTYGLGGEVAADLMEYVSMLRKGGMPVQVVALDARIAG